eukprot:comp21334_c0_seq1/m.29233 comp21334_c0_seq1/g.29233  ORF comp21334_c0_seq1/g.29233 comp21334_c0_seq1/m.29233 type:complete len:431 (-) comp21334_c0_seq1:244-1536(-)
MSLRNKHMTKKGNQRRRRNSNYEAPPDSDDDTESVASGQSQRSMASQMASLQLNGDDENIGTESEEEEEDEGVFELKQALEEMGEKRASTREAAIKKALQVLRSHVLTECVMDRESEIMGMVGSCLRKGGREEQCLAAELLAVVFSQLDNSVRESRYNSAAPTLRTMVRDPASHESVRAECATTLSYSCFLSCQDADRVMENMDIMRQIFADCGEGELVVSAINAWALLLSCIPKSRAEDEIYVDVMPDLLLRMESTDVDVRIAAAEAAAVLWEACRSANESFDSENEHDLHELTTLVTALTTEHAKSKAKKDRLKQRTHTRAVLQYLEDHRRPQERVCVGREEVEVRSWAETQHLNAVRDALASGLNQHILENEVIRGIFGLGPPILDLGVRSVHQHHAASMEKKASRLAAAKAKKQHRSRDRDKRSDF